MKKNLRYKLVTVYMIFAVIMVSVFGSLFLYFVIRSHSKSTRSSMEELAQRVSYQLDTVVREMDKMTLEIISDRDFIDLLNHLYVLNVDSKNAENTKLVDMEYVSLIQKLQRKVIIKNISKSDISQCVVFTEYGDVISNSSINLMRNETVEKIRSFGYLEEVRKRKGKKYIVMPHMDPWKGEEMVVSCFRLLRDTASELGFVEVQCPAVLLDEICIIESHSGWHIQILDDSGEVIYSVEEKSKNDYRAWFQNLEALSGVEQVAFSEKTDPLIMAYSQSEFSGLTVVVRQTRDNFWKPVKYMFFSILLICCVLLLFSMCYIWIASQHLLQPLYLLKKKIENINYDSFTSFEKTHDSNDELSILDEAFERMSTRINQAMQNEMNYKMLQMKADFDALQRQIQPHFIYNTLSVISAMGLEANSREIAKICYKLSVILRYSSSNDADYVSLQEEIDYAETYLALMKYRFEERLEYTVDYKSSAEIRKFPKLVVQPFIENCFKYAIPEYFEVMKIAVVARSDDEEWSFTIRDNGNGFSEEAIKKIVYQMNVIKETYKKTEKMAELRFGGLGILSTYTRLLICFKGNINLKIRNLDCGCEIQITGKVNTHEKI